MVDYSFYTTSFYGEKIKESDFPKFESKAVDVFNYITFNRCDADFIDEHATNVKKAVCAIADMLFEVEDIQKKDAEVKSVSSGGESITYADKRTEYIEAAQNKTAMYNLALSYIRQYLTGTGALYQGL